jgi:asparagine synthase (glutamine-hydrolysing)
MCGIAGFLSFKGFTIEERIPALLKQMGSIMMSRGPDASGEWWDADKGIGLAHRRLAIIDLSTAGNQPYQSKCGRFVLVFNGEIYNHQRLRKMLEAEGYANEWKGHSDTETLIAAFASWGIKPTLQLVEGMFAFAIWDRLRNELTLGRDRAGEKPLYFGWQGDCFLFGSELNAIASHPSFRHTIDQDSLAAFMRYSYVPEPRSIYVGIDKLPPGSIAVVSERERTPEISPYWELCERIGSSQAFSGTPDMAISSLQDLLRNVISDQMVSDAPIGALLSGGVDSSLVVSIMQEAAANPVSTFSIGFDEVDFDEAPHARAIAEALGTKHHELYMTREDVLDIVPRMAEIYDEPFADSSQIPTFLVSRMARNQVKVVLSGDAADELFCGYNRYRRAQTGWAMARLLPHTMRQVAGSMITAIPPHSWNMIAAPFARRSASARPLGDMLHKVAAIIGVNDQKEMYEALITVLPDAEKIVLRSSNVLPLSQNSVCISAASEIEWMMALDFLTFLPGDILTKVDRASMSNSLEVRVPFLDHRVVEFAWSLPMTMKLRNRNTKWILRQLLYKYVPQNLVERPKMGFGVPIGKWLRTILRSWAEDLIYCRHYGSEDHLDMNLVKRLWLEHLSGQRNWQHQIWNILMFLSWLEHNHKAKLKI